MDKAWTYLDPDPEPLGMGAQLGLSPFNLFGPYYTFVSLTMELHAQPLGFRPGAFSGLFANPPCGVLPASGPTFSTLPTPPLLYFPHITQRASVLAVLHRGYIAIGGGTLSMEYNKII